MTGAFRRQVTISLCALFACSALAAEKPTVQSLGGEQSVGIADGRLLHIATDSLNQPHVVADVSTTGVLRMADKIGGTWHYASYATGGSQFYNPHIEINNSDEAWISGVEWYPYGMGVLVRRNMATNPSNTAFTHSKGGTSMLPVSNISIDPTTYSECVLYAGCGIWERILLVGSSFASGGGGTMDTGCGGEKNYFWISKAGNFAHPGGANQPVWHACTDWSYQNSVRRAAGKGNLVWADFGTYPYMGDDGCYPALTSDNVSPQTAYLASDYGSFGGPGIVLNVWRATNNQGDGAFVFSPFGGLLVVDSAGRSGFRRFEPQLCPAKDGGAWLCYTAGGNVKIVYIPSDIQSYSDLGPWIQFPGARGAICTDNIGNLHVTYLNGGVKYREIRLSSLAAVAPIGRVIDQTPTFEWIAPDGITDLTLYYWMEGQAQSHTVTQTVSGTSWTPSSSLTPGFYAWAITGTYDGHAMRSDATFRLPPPAPLLTAPTSRLGSSQKRPAFTWQASEGSTWYNLQLRHSNTGSEADSQLVKSAWTTNTTWTPASDLTVGTYFWKVLGFIGGFDGLWGDWSDTASFPLVVPGKVHFVSPTGTVTYSESDPLFTWTPAASKVDEWATWYNLFIIRDGRIINNVNASGSGWFTEKQGQGTASLIPTGGLYATTSDIGPLAPGMYGLWIQAADAIGFGPWSLNMVQVNRAMQPGTLGAESGYGSWLDPTISRRPTFTWTATPGAPWYYLVVSKDGGFYFGAWTTVPTWAPGTDLPNGSYRWWVNAQYPATGYASPWLTPAAFTVGIPEKSKPLAPSGTTGTSVQFSWTEADGATGYQIWYQVLGNPASKVLVNVSGGSTTNSGVQTISTPGNYRWWISSLNSYGQVWAGEGMDFTVEIP